MKNIKEPRCRHTALNFASPKKFANDVIIRLILKIRATLQRIIGYSKEIAKMRYDCGRMIGREKERSFILKKKLSISKYNHIINGL